MKNAEIFYFLLLNYFYLITFSYIIKDISDRKQMEIVLQESEEGFRLAFEEAAIGMTLVSFDGHFIKANRCKFIG